MTEKSNGTFSKGHLSLFRGPIVWAGIALALGGFLAEQLIGGQYAFEAFMLFGGLNIGIGYEKNRSLRENEHSKSNTQPDRLTAEG